MTARIKPSPTWDHPAKWSQSILDEMVSLVAEHAPPASHLLRVLDPFAGVGRARLDAALNVNADDPAYMIDGVDLQPEARQVDPLTLTGDATALPDDWTGRYAVVVTSPVFGNRMGDHHQAEDRCKACSGSGIWGHQGGATTDRVCPACKGAGVSLRNTYAHSLRRAGGDLVAGSAAGMQWGAEYRALHAQALREMRRVLVEDGLLLVNMSNHVRGKVEQLVAEWWVNEMIVQGNRLVEVRRVRTPRQGFGANGQVRVAGELVIAMRTPSVRRLL